MRGNASVSLDRVSGEHVSSLIESRIIVRAYEYCSLAGDRALGSETGLTGFSVLLQRNIANVLVAGNYFVGNEV